MIKKKRVTDKGGHFSVLFTDQSKACDCLPQDRCLWFKELSALFILYLFE